MDPLVSFCMSTYKRPEELRKQVEALLRQEYQHFEIVISDNDPEGSARQIAGSFTDPRVKYFPNEQNLGMVKSFNRSVERSKGDYIIMITDDDPAYPDLISTLIEVRNNNPGYGVYAGCGDWIVQTDFSAASLNEKPGAKSTLLTELPENGILKINDRDFAPLYLDGYFTKTFLLWSCCMTEREVVLAIGGMPDYGSELLTDHAYMIAASSVKGMVFINKALGGQSVRGDNFGYNFSRIKDKYLSTPALFVGYLKQQLEKKGDRKIPERKAWTFAGRMWVEYSLMIYRTLRLKKESTKEFFVLFKKVFSNGNLRKWKYKFYLKAYFPRFFKLLLKLKGK